MGAAVQFARSVEQCRDLLRAVEVGPLRCRSRTLRPRPFGGFREISSLDRAFQHGREQHDGHVDRPSRQRLRCRKLRGDIPLDRIERDRRGPT